MKMNKSLKQAALAGAVAAAGLFGATSGASAYVVCNRDGDCWHTDHRYRYPGAGYVWHPDDWYFHRTWAGDRWHWRDSHEGRGYWRGGVWVRF